VAGKIDWWEVLDLFCWGFEKLSRPTLRNLLGDFDHEHERVLDPYFWRRLEAEQWVTRTGRGSNAQFTITAKGKQCCAESDPSLRWKQPWDGRWRIVTFDVPEQRRKDRVTLWRELRDRRLGLLQRSVWIWPGDLEPILQEIIQASGIPECFAGFECTRLFLCSNAEIVKTAWDFDSICHAQQGYLKKIDSLRERIRHAESLRALGIASKEERMGYSAAFTDDPILPRELWPEDYQGDKVCDTHKKARVELSTTLKQLMSV